MRDTSRLLSNSRRCYLYQLVKPCIQYHCILWLAIMLCFGVMLRFVLYICNFSYYIFATFRIIYLQLFVLYICNFSYYIFATFVLYFCNFSYYIFATFVLYFCNFSYYILATFVLYFCNFSYYIFATFRIIYIRHFSYYIFDTLRIIYLQLRIIKSHFRIMKLGYVLKNLCSYCK